MNKPSASANSASTPVNTRQEPNTSSTDTSTSVHTQPTNSTTTHRTPTHGKTSAHDIVVTIAPDKSPRPKWSKRKKIIVFSIAGGIVIAIAVIIILLIIFNRPSADITIDTPDSDTDSTTAIKRKYYSTISGEQINDPSEDTLPTYCIQIPNGVDGARPHVGLHEAKIIYEAIAEAGITRFAAVYQNPQSSIIGPIRSLRQYYLDWDTPLDCTIVHAGGSAEALNSLASGNYRDLTESRTYMFRDYSAYYAPNNLFTSGRLLTQWSIDYNALSSTVKSFPHYTPKQAATLAKEALTAANDTEAPVPLVTKINVRFGWSSSFNVNYTYDTANNNYLRAYEDGQPHTSYTCPPELTDLQPQQNCGTANQLTPSVVAVIKVNQWLDTDGYHQKIQTIGSGEAYLFQNGTVISGTWSKTAANEQITFTDAESNVIKLNPGQLWISAIPANGGSISWE